ncbi:MAG: FAD-dependent oxidoreductase [Ilumatobacteraceae bacterium]
MTDRAQVVVIGGGIAGVSAAYHLCLRGWTDVLLLERDELSSGSTWHAAGNVPTFSGTWSVMRLQQYSADLYRRLADDVESPVSYHVTGSVRLAHTRERMAEFQHIASMAQANGMEYDVLSPSELVDRYPLVQTHDLVGALWDPLDGDIDPSQITQALARAARRMGCRIQRSTRVTGLEQKPNHGWVVTTPQGQIGCEVVLNAAGYRAGEVMALIGRGLPIVSLSHQYLVTEEIPELAERDTPLPLLRDPDASYYLRQERNGYILGPYEWDVAPMWRDGIPDEFANRLWPADLDRLEKQILDAGERVPVLAEAGIARVINGPIPYSPDGYPYLGPERGLRNFFHCNTFSFGIAQGGGAGMAIADWIIDGQPPFDVWSVDRRRFKQYATFDYTVAKAVEVYQNEYAVAFPFEERPAGRPSYRSPLYDTLAAKGAAFGARGGWERPVYLDTDSTITDHTLTLFRTNGWRPVVAAEVDAARHRVALLDLPGFTKFEIRGPGAADYLDQLVCSKLPRVGHISLVYALTTKGTVLSEFTFTRLGDEHFYVVGAASAEWHDLDLLEASLPHDGSVTITNRTHELGSLVIIGPRSRDVLNEITSTSLENDLFPWLSCRDIQTSAGSVRALRVSYVGELGWELHAATDQLVDLYDQLWQAGQQHGIRDIGIYAVDSMRLDKCYRSWKADLEIGFSPLDASLDRFIDFGKECFVGRDPLFAERDGGPRYRFVPLRLDHPGEADAPANSSIFRGDERVGIVTSGGWSFTLDCSIALGYVEPSHCSPGTKLQIEIFGQRVDATVGAEPLYDPENKAPRA